MTSTRGRLEGRSTVIVGAADGIGAATAAAFAAEGANVVIVDIDDVAGSRLAETIDPDGSRVVFRHGDQSSEADIDGAVAFAVERFGRVDVAMANAGIGVTRRIVDLPLGEWQRVIDVNLTGAFLLTRAAFRAMATQGTGVVLMTSSPHGLATSAVASAYAASKAGILGLVRAAAIEGAPLGVRVAAIIPGATDTPMVRSYVERQPDPDAARRSFAEIHAIKRLGRPDEVAAAAVFLASDEASFVTGSSLYVEGGLLARQPGGVEYAESDG